jgi:hypothetical protein
LINRVAFGLPLLLNVEFIDSPTISLITGNVGGVRFEYIYAGRTSNFDVTSKEQQEERVRSSWRRLQRLESADVRLFAALHWLQVACRLELAGNTPWEFMSEILLNLAKILEVLFPGPEGATIEASRDGLRALAFRDEQIEAWFIPALGLRNGLDVAHVSLAELSPAHLEILHTYAETALVKFRMLMRKVMDSPGDLRDGASMVKPDRKAIKLVERLGAALKAAESTSN